MTKTFILIAIALIVVFTSITLYNWNQDGTLGESLTLIWERIVYIWSHSGE